MNETQTPLQLPQLMRQLRPNALHSIQHQQQPAQFRNLRRNNHAHSISLASSFPAHEYPGFTGGEADAFVPRLAPDLTDGTTQSIQQSTPFGRPQRAASLSTPSRKRQRISHDPQITPQNEPFGPFSALPTLPGQDLAPHRAQPESSLFPSLEAGTKAPDHGGGFKLISDPPDLREWREKLFNVEDTIYLTEQQYLTYFPHVDNVYSHRSTQKYKRKPFISYYWDCRLKGRPPGTPKSNDPSKRNRKRTAREKDLCDVKIKITEHFHQQDGSTGLDHERASSPLAEPDPNNFFAPGQPGGPPLPPSVDQRQQQQGSFDVLESNDALPFPAGPPSQKYYTVQRVNGNGANGKTDGVAGPHKHTLEESDKVKKNSVQRHFLKLEKEKRKTENPEKKTYHTKASGAALSTVKAHAKEHELKLYGSCFCPFVQRVWIALEFKHIRYQYIETDPYSKPQSLLDVNPRGLVPALRHGDWGCYESSVLMEYLEDCFVDNPLLTPGNPRNRAYSRLWSDHINRNIIPKFYHYLQAQEIEKQIQFANELQEHITKIVEAADVQGPFFSGPRLSFVDVQFAPWMLRLSRVLKPYRGWPDADPNSRWGRWIAAVENDPAVVATTSSDVLYLESYERYAENRPNTSQLASAINAGTALP